jgi:hypothetical protein
MPGQKLSAKSQETVEYLESVMRECDHWASLVEQFASAKNNPDQFSSQLSRELGQLRQKAMIRNQGFIADTAGQLSVAASRGGSPIMKSRMLRDGVGSLKALLERTIKATIQADESEKKEKEYQAAKERKTQADHIKARVLAEEAREVARKSVAAAPQPGAPGAAASQAKVTPAAPKAAPSPAAKAVPPPAAKAAPPPGAKPAPAAAPKAGPGAAQRAAPVAAPKAGPAPAPAPAPPGTPPMVGPAAPKPAAAPVAQPPRAAPPAPKTAPAPPVPPSQPPKAAPAPVPGQAPAPSGAPKAAPIQPPGPASGPHVSRPAVPGTPAAAPPKTPPTPGPGIAKPAGPTPVKP